MERRKKLGIDRYKIISTLSQHPHSTVWLAEHISLGVKRIIKACPKNSRFYDNLSREAEILKNLNHPQIPAVIDFFEDEKYLCIVEQYVEGESLGYICSHCILSNSQVFHYIIQVCSIIKYLHNLPATVLHLDIKPDNIIVSGDAVYLIDFGSAVCRSKGGKYAVSVNRRFAAPEQEEHLAVSCSSDVYALGRLLEYLLEHSNMSGIERRAFQKIALRCDEKYPWKRISSADTLLKMLQKQRRTETKQVNLQRKSKRNGLKGSIIGVIGLGPGEGTTHIAITLACCLAEFKGLKVGLTEKSDHSDIYCFMKNKASKQFERGESIGLNGVTYFTSGLTETGDLLIKRGFDCVVCDLGSNFKKAAGLLEKCDKCIAVAGAAPWRAERYAILNSPEAILGDKDKWMVFINLADRAVMMHINGIQDMRMLPFPFVPNPLNPDKATVNIIEKAMN